MTLKARYEDHLRNMPPPGQGRHGAALGIANLGIMAEVTPEEIHSDIRRVSGLPDAEIHAAIMKAANDHGACGSKYRLPPKPAPLVKDGQAALRRIIDAGTISDDVGLWELSPIRLDGPPEDDRVSLLKNLFKLHEYVFIGDRLEFGILGQSIRTVAEWIVFFATGGTAGPFIIVNPLNGIPAPTKSGKADSLRGDGNVNDFRHCLVEFDDLIREDQIKFWSATKLPILALIDSGGKSIHAWLDVQKLFKVATCEQWNQEIKMKLYERVLIPLGVDRACCNSSRLSRLPGVLRPETGRFQRLLWLSPEGREVVR